MSAITDQLDTLMIEVFEHGKTITAGAMLNHLRTLIYAQERALQLAIHENAEKDARLLNYAVNVCPEQDGQIERLRTALKLIRMYAGNTFNGKADKAAIRGIVDDVLEDGDNDPTQE